MDVKCKSLTDTDLLQVAPLEVKPVCSIFKKVSTWEKVLADPKAVRLHDSKQNVKGEYKQMELLVKN